MGSYNSLTWTLLRYITVSRATEQTTNTQMKYKHCSCNWHKVTNTSSGLFDCFCDWKSHTCNVKITMHVKVLGRQLLVTILASALYECFGMTKTYTAIGNEKPYNCIWMPRESKLYQCIYCMTTQLIVDMWVTNSRVLHLDSYAITPPLCLLMVWLNGCMPLCEITDQWIDTGPGQIC